MKWLIRCVSVLFGLYSASLMSANPIDAHVVHGQVEFSNPSANVLQVTNSPNSIINWQQFNINQNELVRFIQENANSAVLNRVVGQDPSAILGGLESNGRVFVINPNGIVFGENATVNTAGLVASTLNLNDEDFLKGQYRFEAGHEAGAIENNGFLMAGPGGEVILIAPQIRNAGVIQVESGHLILAAGEKITLTSLEMEGIQFEVQAPDNEVINLGELVAKNGSIGVFADSILHSGTISANSVSTDSNGNIVLRAQSNLEVTSDASITANGIAGGNITLQSLEGDTVVRGTVHAVSEDNALALLNRAAYHQRLQKQWPNMGAEYLQLEELRLSNDALGGRIQVLGNRVGLFGHANINASGLSGGGEILIGGAFQGLGETQTAVQTQVGANATIHADAINRGDGGTVIIWADGFTQALGEVTARGGRFAGNGGFVEISGKETLQYAGSVDTSAPAGLAGNVLFDPRNITIGSAPGVSIGLNDDFLEAPSTDVTINSGDLTALWSAQSVTLQAHNNITVQSVAINSTGGFNLTLQSGNSIFINSANVTSNGGNITLIANSPDTDGVLDAWRADGQTGNIVVGDGSTTMVNSGGGDIFLEVRSGAGLTAATPGQITIDSLASVVTGNGDITFRADSGPTFNASSAVNAGTGAAFIVPRTLGTTIGLSGGAGTLSYADGALDAISADRLVLGSPQTGNITVGNTFGSPAGVVNLELHTNGDIIFNQGAAQGLDADTNNVVLYAPNGAISKPSSSSQDVFAANLIATAANGIRLNTHLDSLSFSNTGDAVVRIEDNSTNPLTLVNGANSSTNFETVLVENNANLIISGSLTLNSNNNGNQVAVANNITNNGAITNNGSGYLRIVSTLNAAATVTNSGTISSNGTIDISAGTGSSSFINTNTGTITTGSVAGSDIIIVADDFDLQAGGTIDAGINSKTVLFPASTGTDFALGNTPSSIGLIGLTQAELNTISNNLVIGDLSNTDNITIDDPINFAGLNLHLMSNAPISQTAAIVANALIVESNADITLSNINNNVSVFQAISNGPNGLVSFSDTDGFQLDGVDFVGGDVVLLAGGAISQAGAAVNRINATTLTATVASDSFAGLSLGNSENVISGAVTLRVRDGGGSVPSTGDIDFANNGNTDLAQLETLSNASILSAGNLTQSGVISADRLSVTAHNGITLMNASNGFNSLVATNNTQGQLTIRNGGGDLTIVPSGVQNLSSNATDNLAIINSAGSLNVDGLIAAQGGSVTVVANGTGSDLIVNTDIFSGTNLSLTAGRDIMVNGTSIGGAGVAVDAGAGDIDITTGRNLGLQGGTALGEDAGITALQGDVTLTVANNLALLGGDGNSADAWIEALNIRTGSAIGGNLIMMAGSGVDSGAGMNASGTIALDVIGNTRLIAGNNTDSSAVMSNRNAGDNLTVSLNIGGDLSLTGGGGVNAAAAIGADNGDIAININAANVSLTAGTGGGNDPGSLAALGAVGPGNNASVTIQAVGDVTLSSNANAAALIGSQQSGGTITVTAGFAGGEGDININNGLILSTGNVGLVANAGQNRNGDIHLAGGVLQAGSLGTDADGQFLMDAGLLDITGGLINNDLTINGGRYFTDGTVNHRASFTQNGGWTELSDARFNVDGAFDLLGGLISGTGIITTPTLNHVAGKIAPGTSFAPLGDQATVIGSLAVNGNVVMGELAELSLDLAGAQNLGGEAGVDYDVYAVGGHLTLNGELQLVVDVRNYFASVDDRYAPIRFQTAEGELSQVVGFPQGYAFDVRLGEGGLGVLTISAPGGDSNVRISEDELETLLNDFETVVEHIHQTRRMRRMQQREDEEDEEDDSPRKSLICSI